MSARPRKIPAYRLHKPTGQAVVRLDGRDIYLGRHDTLESHEKYRRVVAEWLATGLPAPVPVNATSAPALSVAEVILAFWKHAQAHYRAPTARPPRSWATSRPPSGRSGPSTAGLRPASSAPWPSAPSASGWSPTA